MGKRDAFYNDHLRTRHHRVQGDGMKRPQTRTTTTQTRRGSVLAVLLSTILLASCAPSQQRAKPPVDRPFAATQEVWDVIDKAIAPLVADARHAYPEARARYLSGLPAGHRFLVTARLYDQRGKFEQAFIEVSKIEGGRIEGIIANQMNGVQGYVRGQAHTVPEAAILDWTIVRPDASEEGNLVGRFLDYYRPGKVFGVVVGLKVDERRRVTSVRVAQMLDPASASTEPAQFTPPSVYVEAVERRFSSMRLESPRDDDAEFYVVLFYDPLQPGEAIDEERFHRMRRER